MTEIATHRPHTRRSFSARLSAVVAREQAAVVLGLAAIVAHLLDDSFVQPEAGTSAGDHLLSGLAPTAVVSASAWVYPRLSAGARATLAIALGLFGLVAGGSEAGYHLVAADLSGDDYSGLLAMLGGFLLVLCGVALLWRTRRLDETRLRRYLRRSLVGIAAAVVFFQIAFPILFAYGYTHYGRSFAPEADPGAAYEDAAFTTSDGLRLSGWYVPSKNRAAVIVLPAGGRNEGQEHVRMLVRHGYGVLIFDLRGTGGSEGDPYRWGAERDVEAALAYIRARTDVDSTRIGGLGLSLGGELMLQTAGETDGIRAVVSEGAGIRSIREQWLKSGAAKWLSAPFWTAQTAAIAVFSHHAPPPNLNDLVARIAPRPAFLIYSGHPVGGEELNAKFFAAAGRPKTLWEIPEASHTGGLQARPAEYERRVIRFFDKALLLRP